MSDSAEIVQLLNRAHQGDGRALGELFTRHRDRLRRLVELRLDARLQGRIDPSDVLQEAFLEVSRSLADYTSNPQAPFYLWLRLLTCRKLQAVHRRHLGVQMRDAGREVSLRGGDFPAVSSVSLADHLADAHSSPSRAVAKAELRLRIQAALSALSELDREVLALRHFEQLSNAETAHALGISQAAASVRYVRALERLRPSLEGLMEP